MKRHIGIGAVLVLVSLVVAWTPADSNNRRVSCPDGKVIHSVDFHTKTVDCVSLKRLFPALAFITVERDVINGLAGPHIIITGANVHIRSGSGATDDNSPLPPLGLGNLVIGYNEEEGEPPVDRGGSHNVVIGSEHRYTSFGGLIAGLRNTVSARSATVSAGFGNTASGAFSNVSAGQLNQATGDLSSVTGGFEGNAQGFAASVSGGLLNFAAGSHASVTGGFQHKALGDFSSISGGFRRSADGQFNWVAGDLFQDE